MLLNRLTHQSLKYVQPFDDEKIVVEDQNGRKFEIHSENVCKDWDRTLIAKVANAIKSLWTRI